MTLAFDREGRLLAGTESPGRVFQHRCRRQAVRAARLRVQRNPHAAGRSEGRHLRARRSARRAAGDRRRRSRAPEPPSAPPIASVSTEIIVDRHRRSSSAARAAGPAADPAATPGPGDGRDLSASCRTARRISCGSRAKTRRTTSRSKPTAALLVATGNKGKIYRLAGDPHAADARRARQRAAGHGAAAGPRRTRRSSPRRTRARCCGCRPTRAERGTYTSDVRDAQTVATWGAIKWQRAAPAGTKRRDLDALGQYPHAGRDVERLEHRLRERRTGARS